MTKLAFRPSLAATLLGGVILFAPAAADAQSLRDRVIADIDGVLKKGGAKSVSHGDVSGDDSNFTVKDYKIVREGDGTEKVFTAPTTTFSNVAANASGGYTIGSIAIQQITGKDDESTLTVGSMNITAYSSATAGATQLSPFAEKVGSLKMSDITYSEPNTKFSVASISASVDPANPNKGSASVSKIVVPVDAANPEMKDIVALGYKEIAVDVDSDAVWDEKAQRLSLDRLTIAAKDMGTLNLSFAFGNVSQDALKQLQASKDDANAQLTVLQSFTIEQIALRFDNASIVDRMLDAQAKAQNTKRDQYVVGLSAMVPLMIASMNNKPFEKKVSDAVAAFLKAPKSIAIIAKPAQPVPVAQVVGTAMVAPQTIPSVLAVDVLANK
ncbi:hypothetical protein [Prosthecodimorpha staleyi]|uniref:Uncharacterized protein n=1 Tax=Prosthecodimorpha staleyi TaxID=2840188 RepID=A0A947DCI7_9HYPH|nr:hypothetical protein [Prosthecodimorpha staleyi]MBT9292259.1 hypothetical protein [Prosthecodimorpha staleyi]